ncbi:hypothetical protein [Maritimibacter sp. DP1N21-5]|uniref:hypothetical protein n=1 Tax=Maritimibacter sp. DP1N21-5 TaxID=2836867 RepID=UPI001C489FB8|nr:hypothetical protein [Maritimibacter sp. DP1N21-5]MBV7410701.1 hypothetical protein [Maritimibacter sp. DP1N21-5]
MQTQTRFPTIVTRTRLPLVDRASLYGEYYAEIAADPRREGDLRDRAAYMHITGKYPSHLRPKYTRMLTQISRPFRKPSSLDGRTGYRKLDDDAIRALNLNQHEMVKAVRKKLQEGFVIQPSRGYGTRNGYGKIFMFKMGPESMISSRITVNIHGAIKDGWS